MAEAIQNAAKFFTYKGFPLVRCKDTIYYGNMYDKYVVMMNISEKEEVNGIEVAKKLTLYKMLTDEKLNPMEAIEKTATQDSLYDALNIAYIWLTK